MNLEKLLEDFVPSTKSLTVLESELPKGFIITVHEGGYLVLNQKNIERNIESSFNQSDLSGNNAIQADNVIQTQIASNGDLNNTFQELQTFIQSLKEDITREQAEMNAEILKDAIETGDTSKSEKYLKFLIATLGTVQPLITIANLIGIPIPNTPAP